MGGRHPASSLVHAALRERAAWEGSPRALSDKAVWALAALLAAPGILQEVNYLKQTGKDVEVELIFALKGCPLRLLRQWPTVLTGEMVVPPSYG
jgi:hypothetical protein